VKRLTLLRHAKSSWAEDGKPDRERPLAPRGRKAARRLGGYLRDEGVRPDLVLCSPAARTRETLELIRPGLRDDVEVQVEEGLYGAGAKELLDRLRRLPDAVGWAMVVGHNPGLQQLVVLLARDGPLRERAREHYPTGALATLRLSEGGWPDLAPGRADLLALLAPRELR
jgi:phosphohistidine phosphatase